jgi:hypothetical protein
MTIDASVREAFANFLKKQSLPIQNIYKAVEGQTRKVPCIVCDCQTGTDRTEIEGLSSCVATVEVHTNAHDTTEAKHNAWAKEVFDTILWSPTIKADLSANATDFTALFVQPLQPGYRIDGSNWVSFHTFRVECVPWTIPAS